MSQLPAPEIGAFPKPPPRDMKPEQPRLDYEASPAGGWIVTILVAGVVGCLIAALIGGVNTTIGDKANPFFQKGSSAAVPLCISACALSWTAWAIMGWPTATYITSTVACWAVATVLMFVAAILISVTVTPDYSGDRRGLIIGATVLSGLALIACIIGLTGETVTIKVDLAMQTVIENIKTTATTLH